MKLLRSQARPRAHRTNTPLERGRNHRPTGTHPTSIAWHQRVERSVSNAVPWPTGADESRQRLGRTRSKGEFFGLGWHSTEARKGVRPFAQRIRQGSVSPDVRPCSDGTSVRPALPDERRIVARSPSQRRCGADFGTADANAAACAPPNGAVARAGSAAAAAGACGGSLGQRTYCAGATAAARPALKGGDVGAGMRPGEVGNAARGPVGRACQWLPAHPTRAGCAPEWY